MGEFFVYILKSSFCLALFYLFYRLLFTRETFHRFNRIGILVLILLSVLIPLVKFSVEEPVIVQQSLLDLEYLLLMATMTGGVEETVAATPVWIRLLLWGYIVGSLISGVVFLCSCLCMFRIIRKGEVRERLEGGVRLVVTRDPVAPFSWMRWIVISRKDREEGGEEIISHEMAHIQSRHSVDLLITEICILFHWFNPAVWLFKQELQNIHEYEADERVLQKGIDAKRYQLLLIKKAVGSQRFTSMANSFNHRSLKKRISMMLKRKSNPWARLKYAFVLPLAALAVAAFARPEISNELEKISTVKISEIVPKKETIEEKTLVEEVVLPDTTRRVTRSVPVEVEKVTQESWEVTQESWKKVEEVNKVVEEQLAKIQPEIDKAMEKHQAEIEKIMWEKQPEIEEAMKLHQVEMEKVMKVHQAEIEKLIKEKQPEIDRLIQEKQQEVEQIMREKQPEPELFSPATFQVEGMEQPPLILVDGEEIDNLQEIAPENIQSVSILKDRSASDLYGEKGLHGVVLITTKNANKKINNPL